MEVFNNWEKVDDSLQDQFMFFYKGKKVKFTDIKIIVYGEK